MVTQPCGFRSPARASGHQQATASSQCHQELTGARMLGWGYGEGRQVGQGMGETWAQAPGTTLLGRPRHPLSLHFYLCLLWGQFGASDFLPQRDGTQKTWRPQGRVPWGLRKLREWSVTGCPGLGRSCCELRDLLMVQLGCDFTSSALHGPGAGGLPAPKHLGWEQEAFCVLRGRPWAPQAWCGDALGGNGHEQQHVAPSHEYLRPLCTFFPMAGPGWWRDPWAGHPSLAFPSAPLNLGAPAPCPLPPPPSASCVEQQEGEPAPPPVDPETGRPGCRGLFGPREGQTPELDPNVQVCVWMYLCVFGELR